MSEPLARSSREARRELGRVVRDRLLDGTLAAVAGGRYTSREGGVCRACFVAALVIAIDGDDEALHGLTDRPAAEYLSERLMAHFGLEELARAELLFEYASGSPIASLFKNTLSLTERRTFEDAMLRRHDGAPVFRDERFLWLAAHLAETGDIP